MNCPISIVISSALGLVAGLGIGFFGARRKRSSPPLPAPLPGGDPSLSKRLEAMERARDAAELANLEMRRALDELQLAAGTDRLTGAWNRRRFEEAAAALMALAGRRREPLCLILFDLDHFKSVNDTWGHSAGDILLTTIVQIVQGQLRASDYLARWGGEEFIVLASGTELAGGIHLAEKIRAAVADSRFPNVGRATISLGVAEYQVGERLDMWIERVDAAMYRAKHAGRNRVEADESPEPVRLASACSLLELAWDEGYASGKTMIDMQHRQLFDLTNALIGAMLNGAPAADLSLRLQVLLAHVAQHFHDEEALLGQAGYADLEGHAKLHALLMGEAHQLQSEVQASRLDPGKLLAFLALELVQGHILSEDRKYFPCFND